MRIYSASNVTKRGFAAFAVVLLFFTNNVIGGQARACVAIAPPASFLHRSAEKDANQEHNNGALSRHISV